MFSKTIFKKHLNEFLDESLILCAKNSDNLYSDDIKWPVFFSNGKYKKFEKKTIRDYDFFINHTLKEQIHQLSTYNILAKFFVTKEIQNYNKKLLGYSPSIFDKKLNFGKDLPLKFLVEYVKKIDGFTKNQKVFSKTFDSFFRFLENMLEDEYVCPLFNFESDISEKGMLIGNVGIRKKSPQEFCIFTNLDDNFNNIPTIFDNLTHVMYTKYDSPDLNSGYEEVRKRFQVLLDTLSLFTVGNPQMGTIFRNINSPWMHYDSSYEKEIMRQQPLIVNKKNLPKIKQIFNSLNVIDFSNKKNKFLEIAIRRFGSALSRTNSVDQLIDLMISVESLYVPNPGEISVRLSNRLSTLLANDDKEREDYWLFTKKVYGIRSGIVHGEGLRSTEINGTKYTLNEILDKLTSINRKSILAYIKLVKNYSGTNIIDSICNDIDIALINKRNLNSLKTKIK